MQEIRGTKVDSTVWKEDRWNSDNIDEFIFNSFIGGACVFEYSPNCIRLLRASKKYIQVMGSVGMTIEDALTLEWEKHLDEENLNIVKHAVEQSVETLDEVTQEYVFHDLPGAPHNTFLRSSLRVIDQMNETYLIYCMNENITAQKEAELKKRAMQEQLNVVMRSIRGGLSVNTIEDDGQFRFLFANDAYYRMFGYNREELMQMKPDLLNLVLKEDQQYVRTTLNEVRDSKMSVSFEYRCVTKEGDILLIRCDAAVVETSEIENTVIIEILTDVSEMARSIEKERTTSYQLKAIMENVGSGIIAIKVVNNKASFVFSNDRFFEILGYTKDEYFHIFGNSLGPIVQEDNQLVTMCLKRAIYTTEPVILEYRVIRKDGKEIWVRSHITQSGYEHNDGKILLSISDDITDEKEVNEQIRVLNENLVTLMKDVPGGYIRLKVSPNGNGILEEMNDGFCKMVGMNRHEIKEQFSGDIKFFIHPEDCPKVNNSIKEAFTHNGRTSVRYRLLQKGGEYNWVQMHGRLTKCKDGEYYLNAYNADLSEQEKEEIEILDTLPILLRAIMESSTDLVFAKDTDYKYICCSKAFMTFAGLKSLEEIVGKTDYDLFEKELADQFRKDDYELFLTGNAIVDKIEPIPSNDGMTHYSSTSKYILKDSKGNISGIYGTGRDITEYRSSDAKLKLLTDSIPGGIATYLIKDGEVTLIYYNEGFYKLLGFENDLQIENRKSSLFELIDPEDIEQLKEQLKRLINHDIPMDIDYRIYYHDDFKMKWINLRGVIYERRENTYILNTVQYDVTKSKLEEEANRIHEEELKLAMAQLGRSIGEYDIGKRTLTLSPAYAQNYQVSEIRKNVPFCMLDSGELSESMFSQFKDFINSIHDGNKNGSIETQFTQVNGKIRWERWEYVSICSEEGIPVKALIAIDNTTEQHKMFEIERKRPTLGAENLLGHALIDLTDQVALEYIYEDETQLDNEQKVHFFDNADLVKEYICDEEEQKEYLQMHDIDTLLDQFRRNETEQSIDYRRKLRNGDIIWVRNIVRMMLEPGGADILLFEYCYNIEEEKTTELLYNNFIKDNFEFVVHVNANNHNCMVYYGPKGDEQQSKTIYDADPFFAELLNNRVYPEDEVMAQRNIRIEQIKRNLIHDDKFQFTFRTVADDNTVMVKKLNAYYLDRSRAIIIITLEDITQIMMEESEKNALLENAVNAANQANQAKSEFLSRMSHDMRTPMNAIIGLVGLAKEIDNPPETKEYLENVDASSHFLLGLINDVLDLSRMESGRIELWEEPFSLKDFTHGINTVIKPLMDAKNIDFVIDIDDYGTDILIDKLRFNQIFYNLLSNASKYTPSGGRVVLSSEKMEEQDGKVGIRFAVTDNGIGMSEQFLQKVFNPFSQEKCEFTKELQGSGLGLAIVKRLVEAMQGTITVKSELGKGSIFTVELYVKEVDAVEHIENRNIMNEELLNGIHILLVEDNDINIIVATKMLKRKECQITIAKNGVEALRLFEQSEENFYQIILMDIRMPVMDGIEATKLIRKLDRKDATSIPIIAMTADAFLDDINRTKDAGMNAHITKPIEMNILFRTMIQCINGM